MKTYICIRMTNIHIKRIFLNIKLNKTSMYSESNCTNPVYSTAVILVRLYKEDKAKLTRPRSN